MNKTGYLSGYYAKRLLAVVGLAQTTWLSRHAYQAKVLPDDSPLIDPPQASRGLDPPSTTESGQNGATITFQENKSQAVKRGIFARIKPADGHSMRTLLKKLRPTWQPATKPLLSVTDLGGGDGDMLDQLLPLAEQFDLHVNEPNDALRSAYLDKVGKPAYQPAIHAVSSASLKMEDPEYQVPASDLVLASHALYYTADQWKRPPQTTAEIKSHRLHKLTAALKQDGVLCVILQSNTETGQPGKHNPLAHLAALEAFTYPLMGRDTQNCITAETFEAALEAYNHFLKQSPQYTPLMWQTAPLSLCPITVGDLNVSPHPDTGQYDQSPTVTALLNFYTRNTDEQWPGKKQRQFLDWLQQHCHPPAGQCVITHVNTVMAIMPQPIGEAPDVARIDQPTLSAHGIR